MTAVILMLEQIGPQNPLATGTAGNDGRITGIFDSRASLEAAGRVWPTDAKFRPSIDTDDDDYTPDVDVGWFYLHGDQGGGESYLLTEEKPEQDSEYLDDFASVVRQAYEEVQANGHLLSVWGSPHYGLGLETDHGVTWSHDIVVSWLKPWFRGAVVFINTARENIDLLRHSWRTTDFEGFREAFEREMEFGLVRFHHEADRSVWRTTTLREGLEVRSIDPANGGLRSDGGPQDDGIYKVVSYDVDVMDWDMDEAVRELE